MDQLNERLKHIRCIVSDIDGVATEGGIYLDASGGEIKVFCAKDAPRIVAARTSGLQFIFFTGRRSEAAERRAKELKVELWYKDDLKVQQQPLFSKIQKEFTISALEVLYIGDDWNDLPHMRKAGVSATPADGTPENKAIATFITEAIGGKGVISEVLERVMKVQDTWQAAIDAHFNNNAEVKN